MHVVRRNPQQSRTLGPQRKCDCEKCGLGTTAASAAAVSKTQLVDFAQLLTADGIPVPSKIEGLAFGDDVIVNGILEHTLYVSNDNDFTPATSGLNQFFVVGLSDADLAAVGA